jgi:hypothetical protein
MILMLTKLDEGQVYQRGASLGDAAIATCGDLTEASARAVLLQAVRSINEHIDEAAVAVAPAVWTTADLREQIYGGHVGRGLMLDELLRRERERCAAACDALVVGVQALAPDGGRGSIIAGMCAAGIREMG